MPLPARVTSQARLCFGLGGRCHDERLLLTRAARSLSQPTHGSTSYYCSFSAFPVRLLAVEYYFLD